MDRQQWKHLGDYNVKQSKNGMEMLEKKRKAMLTENNSIILIQFMELPIYL